MCHLAINTQGVLIAFLIILKLRFMIFMIIPLLPAWLMAMLPGLGGGFLSAVLQQGQVNRMNAYNDPRAQIQRLMRAGLPAAAMGTGMAGMQSQLPDLSGLGNAITNVFESDQQRTRGQIMLEELRRAAAEADSAGYNRDQLREETKGGLSPYVDSDLYDTKGKSFLEVGKVQQFYIQNNAMKIQAEDGRIKMLDRKFKELMNKGDKESLAYKQAEAQLDMLLLDLDFKGLNLENERNRTAAKRTIMNRLQQGGLNLFEALLLLAADKLGF